MQVFNSPRIAFSYSYGRTSILNQVLQVEQKAIFLLVTNPVDVLTTIARTYPELKAHRVIGSGTVLDTARFRYILGKRCQLSPGNIHAYVVGEHGDSEVPLFSSVSVAGTPISLLCRECSGLCGADYQKQVTAEVRKAAYEIINRKGATYYGIGLSCTRILRAVLHDERSVLTVSALLDDQYKELEVALSVPSVLGKEGILRRLPLSMDDAENEQFLKIARPTHWLSSETVGASFTTKTNWISLFTKQRFTLSLTSSSDFATRNSYGIP